jgi:hypothetical protein
VQQTHACQLQGCLRHRRHWSHQEVSSANLALLLLLLLLLQVPVGRGTLGRIMNVIGEPVDECGPIGELAPCFVM